MQGTNKTQAASILVVEDNEDTREVLLAFLEMKAYRAIPANNGKEALEYLRRESAPDLIILDWWMPVMDGLHFRSEQMKDPKLAKIPVIVVSAIGDQAGVDANEVFTKPVDMERLLKTVAQYCTRGRGTSD